jgi:TetR/AcrR family transcriptional regulator
LYSKFENLDEEKKQRILNAAMKEFAAKGYDHASTNQIVEEADISKGLLFHYFKNKKQLFLYLYNYCIRLSLDEFYQKMDMLERDLFVKLHSILLLKMEFVKKHPDFMEFLRTAYFEESKEVKQELDGHNRDLLSANTARIFENIDYSKFRSGTDTARVVSTIAWAYEGYTNDFLNSAKKTGSGEWDYDKLYEDAKKYTEFLKSCFYN